MCVGTGQSSISSPSTESTHRPAQEKEQLSLEASFEGGFFAAFHLGIEPGKFSHPTEAARVPPAFYSGQSRASERNGQKILKRA